MKDKKALELIYEPDEYLCTWSVPDGKGSWRALSGSVDARADSPPRGQIYGEVPLRNSSTTPGRTMFGFPQRTEVPVLRASLANGGTLILLDATISYWSSGLGSVTGSAALLNKSNRFFDPMQPTVEIQEPPATRVTGARIQIAALDAIIGTAPISKVSDPTLPGAPKGQWTAQTNPDRQVEWTSGSATLRVSYTGRARAMNAFEFGLRFSPIATLQFPEAMTFPQLVDDYIEPLRRIIAIATGRPQDLTYVAAELEGEVGWFQVFGTAITQEPYESSSKAVREVSTSVRAYEDELSLLDLIIQWRALESDHHPLVETYGSMLHAADQHPRSRFLLLIQALEGMHGAETREQYDKRVATHSDRRAALVEKLKFMTTEEEHTEERPPETLSSDDYKFIKKFLMKRPMSSLDGALVDMAMALPINGMDALASTGLVRGLRDSKRAGSTPEALRLVRNDLAHGNCGYPADELEDVVEVLEWIVRGHALRLLGCPDFVVARVFDGD